MSNSLDTLKSLGSHHCSLMQKYESEKCRMPCVECKYLKEEGMIANELKALEIIKLKLVDMYRLKTTHTLEDYNYNAPVLTQEEFDLLKEVLL